MKFVLAAERKASMPVTVTLPTGSGGTKATLSMTVTFRILPDAEFQAMLTPDLPEDAPLTERIRHARRNVDGDVLRRTVTDWASADLVDETGTAVPYSREALDTIIEHVVPLRAAMAEAYVKAHQGDAKRKN